MARTAICSWIMSPCCSTRSLLLLQFSWDNAPMPPAAHSSTAIQSNGPGDAHQRKTRRAGQAPNCHSACLTGSARGSHLPSILQPLPPQRKSEQSQALLLSLPLCGKSLAFGIPSCAALRSASHTSSRTFCDPHASAAGVSAPQSTCGAPLRRRSAPHPTRLCIWGAVIAPQTPPSAALLILPQRRKPARPPRVRSPEATGDRSGLAWLRR